MTRALLVERMFIRAALASVTDYVSVHIPIETSKIQNAK